MCTLIRAASFLWAVTLAAAPEVLFTYADGRMTVSSSVPRPAWLIIMGLRERYAWKVNYEDPPIVYKGDYVDVTVPTYHPKGPEDHAIDPRTGLLSISFPVPSESEAPRDPLSILNQLVEAYAGAGLPGRFAVRVVGDEFDVVPIAVADEQGHLRQVTPLLDTKVAIARKDWNVRELVNELRTQLSGKTSTRVGMGTVPLNIHERLEAGFQDRPAREVLRAALSRMRGPWAWDVTYGVARKEYFLNIDPVGKPAGE